MKYCVFVLLALTFLLASVAQAGTIQAPLDEMIANAKPGEKIAVIAIMADKVDNASMDIALHARQATLAERHYEVVTALQSKATQTQSGLLSQLNSMEAAGQVEKVRNFWIANMVSFKGTSEAIQEIAASSSIEKVIFDYPVESIQPIKSDEPPPPVIASHPDGLDVMHVPEVWAMGFTGAGRLVSNIDTGVDGTHPALTARWRGNNGHPASQCWFDPVEGTTTPTDHGQHGTHTMGTICGRSTTTGDTVGVAINAQWIAAGSVDYGGTTSDIIASFQFITDPDGNPGTISDVPDCVGNSWGWSPQLHGVPHCDNTFWAVMDGCENAGVVVVFSAGNEGSYGANSLRTPADRATTYFNAFSVGAIDGHTPGYPIAYFSSLGPCSCASGDMAIKPELVAPGYNVYSSIPGGGYDGTWSGTSMASPHITGSVAILRQVNPNLDVNTIKNIILQSCVDLGPTGEDNTYGHGYLDLRNAVQLAMAGFGFIDGYVRNANTNAPVPATITVINGSASTVANSEGHYFLALRADTSYTLRASYLGYYTLDHTVAVVANDTVSQDFLLTPTPPPDLAYDPSTFIVSAPVGNTVRETLNISNLSGGPLYFTLNETMDTTGLILGNGGGNGNIADKPAASPIGYSDISGAKTGDEHQPIYPPVISGNGGPDTYGYTWIDSDDPGGPAFSWVDISGVGTPVTFTIDDQFLGPFPMGITFPFYGDNHTSIYVCSNGFLSFDADTAAYGNRTIPTAAIPNNFIAGLWDDLSPQNRGTVYYYNDTVNNRFIVSFSNVPFFSGGGDLYFEFILYPTGRIILQYGTVNGGTRGLNSLTVGMENQDGSDGLEVVYNADYLHSNMAIKFAPPLNWLSVNVHSGTVNAGFDSAAIVTFDATHLIDGNYTGHLDLLSNDPDQGAVVIPVSFTVGSTGTPNIVQTPANFTDTLQAGQSAPFNMKVKNTGSATLTVAFAPQAAWISTGLGPYNIAPGDSLIHAVTLNATGLAPSTYNSSVLTNSNDPAHAQVTLPIQLRVTAAPTPDINVSVASFNETILTGGSMRDTFFIANVGSGLLYYGLHDNQTWISVTPDTGNVPAAARDTIVVLFDATSLAPGTYPGQITLNSNDTDQPLISLPVNIQVDPVNPGCQYAMGDVNASGVFNGLDVTYGVAYFKGGAIPPYSCECTTGQIWYVAGDVNASCSFNGLDITFMVSYFKGGPTPNSCADCPSTGILSMPRINPTPISVEREGLGSSE